MNDEKESQVAVDAAVQVQSTRGAQAISEALQGADGLKAVVSQFQNAAHLNHVAGRTFEVMHTATANVDAALKGLPQRFATTASQGMPTDSADIVVRVGGQTVAKVQAKLSDSSATLVRRVSDVAYDGMQKVVPVDKLPKVQQMADALAKGGRRSDLSLVDTAKRVSGVVTYEGASSKPISVAEAQNAASQPRSASRTLIAIATVEACGSAAAMGGAFSGVIALAQGGSANDAVKATANGALRGVAQQAATVGVEKVGSAALAQVVSNKAASAFARSGAPGAIAGAGIAMASDFVDLANGKISGGECAERAVKHGVRAGTTWAGAEAGAALGTLVGPIGTAIGGLLGGLLGSFVPELFT